MSSGIAATIGCWTLLDAIDHSVDCLLYTAVSAEPILALVKNRVLTHLYG